MTNSNFGQVTNDSGINGLNITTGTAGCGIANSGTSVNACYGGNVGTVWDYWHGYYYPNVIHSSYPVYIQERAKDSGRQAFEIIKALQDKKLIKLEKVGDFIEAMDTLIKII